MTHSVLSQAPHSFAAYFRLREPSRTTFKLSPERDSRLYVDLDGTIGQIEQALRSDVPKLVIQGDIGTGKTHVLRYAESISRESKPPRETVFVSLSGFEHKTDFLSGIHRPLIGRLLEVFRQDTDAYHQTLTATEHSQTLHANVKNALGKLRSAVEVERLQAEAWIAASRALTPSKAIKAGYSTLLSEIMGPADYVRLYVELARNWKETTGRRLLVCLDETESFSRVADLDAQASIGAGLREMFDNDNDAIGFMLGLNPPRARKGTHPMLRADVLSRSGRPITLRSLHDRGRVEDFLTRLWERLTADTNTLPFTLDVGAWRFLVDRIDEIRKHVLGDQASASATPRDVLILLDLVAQSAWHQRAPQPLREETLRRWVGLPRAVAVGG